MQYFIAWFESRRVLRSAAADSRRFDWLGIISFNGPHLACAGVFVAGAATTAALSWLRLVEGLEPLPECLRS